MYDPQHVIIELCSEYPDGVEEPIIRHQLANKLDLTATRTSKIHLERLENEGIISKEIKKGKPNIWKINPTHQKLSDYIINAIESRDYNRILQFYNSYGVQKFIEEISVKNCFRNYAIDQSFKIPGDYFKNLNSLYQLIEKDQIEDYIQDIHNSLKIAPTFFLELMGHRGDLIPLSACLSFILSDCDDDDWNIRTPVIADTYNAWLFSGLAIDYFNYQNQREKIYHFVGRDLGKETEWAVNFFNKVLKLIIGFHQNVAYDLGTIHESQKI